MQTMTKPTTNFSAAPLPPALYVFISRFTKLSDLHKSLAQVVWHTFPCQFAPPQWRIHDWSHKKTASNPSLKTWTLSLSISPSQVCDLEKRVTERGKEMTKGGQSHAMFVFGDAVWPVNHITSYNMTSFQEDCSKTCSKHDERWTQTSVTGNKQDDGSCLLQESWASRGSSVISHENELDFKKSGIMWAKFCICQLPAGYLHQWRWHFLLSSLFFLFIYFLFGLSIALFNTLWFFFSISSFFFFFFF